MYLDFVSKSCIKQMCISRNLMDKKRKPILSIKLGVVEVSFLRVVISLFMLKPIDLYFG